MPVTELFESRKQTSGDNISERGQAMFEYLAAAYPDETSAIAAVIAAAGPTYGTMRYHSTEIVEVYPNNQWKFRVKFVDVPKTVYSYDSTGGTQHVSQSLNTPGKFGNFSNQMNQAIGFDGEHVDGVDKVVPVFNWTETHYLTVDQLNVPAYYALTGHVNSDAFEGFQPGEVLFYGVKADEREDGLWEVQFKFGYSPNAVNITVGPISGINKNGWDYLWVCYAKGVDPGAQVKTTVPTAVYVE